MTWSAAFLITFQNSPPWLTAKNKQCAIRSDLDRDPFVWRFDFDLFDWNDRHSLSTDCGYHRQAFILEIKTLTISISTTLLDRLQRTEMLVLSVRGSLLLDKIFSKISSLSFQSLLSFSLRNRMTHTVWVIRHDRSLECWQDERTLSLVREKTHVPVSHFHWSFWWHGCNWLITAWYFLQFLTFLFFKKIANVRKSISEFWLVDLKRSFR